MTPDNVEEDMNTNDMDCSPGDARTIGADRACGEDGGCAVMPGCDCPFDDGRTIGAYRAVSDGA